MAPQFKGCIDTTFRDGQQSPLLFDTYKYRFNIQEKKELINGLLKLGVDAFEFFSPVVSTIEKKDFIELQSYIRSVTQKKILLLTHCRTHLEDIKEAVNAGANGLNLYIGASKIAQQFNYQKNMNEITDLVVSVIKTVRKLYPNMYLRFSIEDAFRTEEKSIFHIYDKIFTHVNTFGLPDTVGIASPEVVSALIFKLKKRYPAVDLECHFHNDRGLSVANAIAAVKAGASYIDTSIWGLAERSGITSISSLLLNLSFLKLIRRNSYNLSLCYPLNVLMGSILNMQVPYNEPVSLTNRTHTAGVHQKAVLNNHISYEALDLSRYGVSKNQVLIGPLSGWNLVYYFLREVKGYKVTKKMCRVITSEFKNNSHKINHLLNPEQLIIDIVAKYKLKKTKIPSGYMNKRIENLN